MADATGATYGTAVTIAAVSTGPVFFNFLGIEIPVISSAVGVLAVVLVRVMVITKAKDRRAQRLYNFALTLVCVLGALVTIVDNKFGPGTSFWTGVGFGALGVGIIEIGKSSLLNALRTGLQTMFRTLGGMEAAPANAADPEPQPEPEANPRYTPYAPRELPEPKFGERYKYDRGNEE